ncbi:beta-ketoacyl synthase N-terminal-like domain-containing protein [Paenibacillus pabuli]|uniref:beta-ketoacyl synthase N-terminal-like domain-containing protein n=2 Tax=Paenibacillus pabuli TaxID=1472 RepID=UPI0009EB5309|nr:beta-ketoacyl synthase N-terminal-like domain-containing protein [Paenibacillus pabuli]
MIRRWGEYVMEELNQLLSRLLCSGLHTAGLLNKLQAGDAAPASASAEMPVSLIKRYGRWWRESLVYLQKYGYFTSTGSVNPLNQTIDIDTDGAQAWKEWDKKKGLWLSDPNVSAYIPLLEATLRALPDILTGQKSGTDIIFPNSSMRLVENIYMNNPAADYFNAILADRVAASIKQQLVKDPGAHIRIVEIGAGTGGTSQAVFTRLNDFHPHILEYCYTDLSQAFLSHAQQAYGPQYPYLTYGTFDLSKPVSTQSLQAGTYDIAIATNVMHAAPQIRLALRNVKALLRCQGVFLINEITENTLMNHLTFGLLDGWWGYEDPALRISGGPLLEQETWKNVLLSEGFGEVQLLAHSEEFKGQQVIMGTSNGVVRQQTVKHELNVKHEAQRQTSRISQDIQKKPSEIRLPEVERSRSSEEKLKYIKEVLVRTLCESLKVEAQLIDHDEAFSDYGVDSITGVRLIYSINERLGTELFTTDIFDFPCVNQLAQYIAPMVQVEQVEPEQQTQLQGRSAIKPDVQQTRQMDIGEEREFKLGDAKQSHFEDSITSSSSVSRHKDIAIIGYSGRFPQSDNVDELWAHLAAGHDLIQRGARWTSEQTGASIGKTETNHGAFLEDSDCFDPLFFKISNIEAMHMDPQQRLFLEESWKTLEHAGYAGEIIQGRKCGVYTGYCGGDYEKLMGEQAPAQAFWGNAASIVPARVSYFLNLQGPAIAVDTACSSSLVAIHLACQALWSGEVELALAGGVFVQSTPDFYLSAHRAGMLSPVGRCHTFDERADGFVPGEGVGVLLLKRLEDAIQDGDHVHGIIKGSSINQDGSTNGITAPSRASQERLERQLYEQFGVNPDQIQMVEAHGTGTKLGDPIEFEALNRSFRKYTSRSQYAAIGSIKSNMGHSIAAAGIAGVIKLLLALKHQQIPPSIHYSKANPNIDFLNSPFYVSTQLSPWHTPPGQKRAALVSSFGFSGTNAHLAIEEPPGERSPSIHKPGYLLVLSAQSTGQLREQVRRIAQHYRKEGAQFDYASASFTLMTGRRHLEHRAACVVQPSDDLASILEQWLKTGDSSQIYAPDLTGQPSKEQSVLRRYGNECIQQIAAESLDDSRYVENLHTIAELYVQGYELDYNRLYLTEKYKRIPLPTYPFAREKYWVSSGRAIPSIEKDVNVEISDAAPVTKERRIAKLLGKQWRHSAVTNLDPAHVKVVVGSTRESVGLANKLSQMIQGSQVVLVSEEEHDTGRLLDVLMNCDAFIDLSGCDRKMETEEMMLDKLINWIARLQHMIDTRGHKPLKLLGVTMGLESFQNESIHLGGAERAGLYRMLQSEYSHIISRHIDVDPADSELDIAAQIVQELTHAGKEQEVCYREGQRYSAYLDILDNMNIQQSDHNRLPFPSSHVLWVTGGTRGLGLLCAQHAVQHYGVRKLVLIGQTPFPPRNDWWARRGDQDEIGSKVRAILELEKRSVQIEVLSFDIGNKEKLLLAADHIRSTMGAAGGVIHAAGIADMENPAFIRKPLESIRRVLSPKILGTAALYECFRHDPLQFFVLFSSVAGAISKLGVGQSDYAMANTYMDYYAAANALTSPLISIQWPNWKESGMGEFPSQAYNETGLLSITDEEGLKLLDWALITQPSAVMLPAIMSSESIDAEGQAGITRKVEAEKMSEIPITNGAPIADTSETLQLKLSSIFAEELCIEAEKMHPDRSFEHFGMDSIMIAQLARRMERELQIPVVEPHLFLDHPTIAELTGALLPKYVTRARISPKQINRPEEQQIIQPSKARSRVAIIGMACHFPDAVNLEQFWNNLKTGKNSIREIPSTRWDWRMYYHPDGKAGTSMSKWGAFLDGLEMFDPDFFGMDHSLASHLDPLQRQWLEVSAEALADAGYGKTQLESLQVGVFAGARTGHFMSKIRQNNKQTIIGTGQNFITAHLAHLYNLRGPNMVVDTACSSSLTAIHLAARSLQNGEADLVIAGGVEVLLDETPYLSLTASKVLSPDGQCKTFDASANGIGVGEGCGVIVMKRLEQAIADGDKIYGVIDGSAINNDGHTMGVTTPNPQAQQALIERAIKDANIDPTSISYVETHGTGTVIGDPIELKALTQVLGTGMEKGDLCGVGSVKSNVGHLLSAAGAVSMIKVLLSMVHGQLPPSLNCPHPNPRFRFEESPLFLVQELTPWTNKVLRAGVSAFGLGGNNAHILVSNEGVPDPNKATLEPRFNRIIWNRDRFWPDEVEEKNLVVGSYSGQTNRKPEHMLSFFTPKKLQ